MKINYLAIIPARSGSKGVKNKNIMMINHQPLLKYVGDLAENNSMIDGIFLSTDSEEYLKIFNDFSYSKNITGTYLRKVENSQDNSTPYEYLSDLFEHLKLNDIDVVNFLILQPTNPLTSSYDIKDSINRFELIENKILVSVSKPIQHLGCMINIDRGFKFIVENSGSNRQSYDFNPYFINGNIYIMSKKEYDNRIKEDKSNIFLIEDKTNFYYQNINTGFQIDYYNDLFLVENHLMNKFLDQGWDVYKNIFTLEEVDYLKKEIFQYVNKYKGKMEKYDINYTKDSINSIHCLHKFDNTFKDFFNNHQKLNKIASRLLNEDVEITNIESFLKPTNGLEVPLHQDNRLFCVEDGKAFTAWISLDNIDKNNGGLKVWPYSNRLGLLKHRPSMMLGTSQTIDESEYDKFDKDGYIINNLSPGDIQFHHCMTIHASDQNKSLNSRNVLTIQYKAVNSKFDRKKLDEYRNEVIKQQNLLKGSNY